MAHTLTRMHDGRFLGVDGGGTWWLWDYDPHSPDVLLSPPHRQGRWQTINSTHELFTMADGRVLDWRPSDGAWRLWDYRPDEPDVLTGPNASGTWQSIRTGHALIPLPDGTVLDWGRVPGTWRLWQYDAGDADRGRLHRRRIPGQPWDIFPDLVEQGSWRRNRPVPRVRIPVDHELVPFADGRVLDWAPDGRWRLWDRNGILAPAADQVLDGVEPVPLRSGEWGSIRAGHTLIPTGDGKVIDWIPVTGAYWLWSYSHDQQQVVPYPPLQAGVWRSLSELPERLQFRLRYFMEHESTDSGLQGASDEVYLSGNGLDSATVVVGPDGRPTTGQVTSPIVGDVSEDAVRDPWRQNPYVLLEFDLKRLADWPRSFSVTLMFVEEDNEDLRETFDAIEKKVGKEVETAVVTATTTAVGAAVGSIIPGVGTVVGAAVGAISGLVYEALIDEIKKGLGNEVFTPVTRTLVIDDPAMIRREPDIGRPQTLTIAEHGAKYELEYDWHLVF